MAQILQKVSLIVFIINTKSKPCERLASSGTGMVEASLVVIDAIVVTTEVSLDCPFVVVAALVRSGPDDLCARFAGQTPKICVALVVIEVDLRYKPPWQILHVTVIAPKHHLWTALVIGRTVAVCPPTAVNLPSSGSATVTLSVRAAPAAVPTQAPTGIWY